MPSIKNKPVAISETGHDTPRRILRLHEAVTLIVGLVIGAGIFKTPAVVAHMTGNTIAMFGSWILGGIISLIGALCYAELASRWRLPFPAARLWQTGILSVRMGPTFRHYDRFHRIAGICFR